MGGFDPAISLDESRAKVFEFFWPTGGFEVGQRQRNEGTGFHGAEG